MPLSTSPPPVSLLIPIAWGEMDALGHVNNVAYFRYLESARIEYLRRLGYGAARGADQSTATGGGLAGTGPGGVGFILQSVQCRFRRPVVFPDTLRVTACCIEIGDDRFTLSHEVHSTAMNDVAAVGQGTIVCYDYARGTKTPMPQALRDAIATLERTS